MRLLYLCASVILISVACTNPKGVYVCPPCDLDCDTLTFSKAGICPHCKMELVKREDLILEEDMVINHINIKAGSGQFLVEGGLHKDKPITVHYYKAKGFGSGSAVIFIVHGAGRNGDDYRDAWIELAEQYNLLVLAPTYSNKHYPGFWNYNLAGMLYDVDIEKRTFKVSQNPEEWIFGDFDRIFSMVKNEMKLGQNTYDMFGHSAGAQLLHRMTIFYPENKAQHIVAANSGWYTLPDTEEFPYGLNGTNNEEHKINFASELILLLGEQDNENETRGSLRKTPEANRQGLHRFARGQYFYRTAQKVAEEHQLEFKWKMEIVPGIGHDHKEMSKAAAKYLYGE